MHDEHLLMTICPKHRNDFGIGWRCQKKLCQVPQSMAPHHKSKKRRKEKTLTFSHSSIYLLKQPSLFQLDLVSAHHAIVMTPMKFTVQKTFNVITE